MILRRLGISAFIYLGFIHLLVKSLISEVKPRQISDRRNRELTVVNIGPKPGPG